jgi:hypothetical protein
MSRIALRVLAAALVAGAALSPVVASAQSPALRVHAIFADGRAASFHVGEVLDVDVPHAGGRKLAQVCLTPAPISRPACSASRNVAPSQAGPTTVTATLSDGTKLARSFTVHARATKVGGRWAVPATIRCRDVTLFGNYDQRRHRSRDPRGTVQRGARVALYNRIAPGKIFMWDYAANVGGFASEACAQTAAA